MIKRNHLLWVCMFTSLLLGIGGAFATPLTLAGSTAAVAPPPPCPTPPVSPGVPQLPLPCDKPARPKQSPAHPCIQLQAEQPRPLRAGQTIAYQIVARDTASRPTAAATLRVPIHAPALEMLATHFTRADAWVTSVQSDTVTLHVPALYPGDTLTATLYLRTTALAAPGSQLDTRVQIIHNSASQIDPALSNRVSITIGSAPKPAEMLSITHESADQPAVFQIAYDGFSAYEAVSLWYDRPDGTSLALAQLHASAAGRLSYRVPASILADALQVVAFGACSQTHIRGNVPSTTQ